LKLSVCAALAAAALAALQVVIAEPHRRRELLQRAASLRQRLSELGWTLGQSTSQIIPIIVGRPQGAVELSQRLRQRGLEQADRGEFVEHHEVRKRIERILKR